MYRKRKNIKKILSPEHLLLFMALGESILEEKPQISAIDQDEFVRLVKHHRLESILFTSKTFNEALVGQSLFERLSVLNKRNKMKMFKLTSELIRIHKLFAINKIEYISLKGPALSSQLYGDFSIRNSRDLDILVSEETLLKAKEGLEQASYYTKSSVSKMALFNNKEIKLIHSKDNILLELHHRLFNNKELFPFKAQYLEMGKWVKINDCKIAVLPKAQQFLYIITHAASHNWSRLTWALDVIKFKELMTYEELKESKILAKNVGLEKVFEQSCNFTLSDYFSIAQEEHYSLFKKMNFLLGLNSKMSYKLHELLHRALIPYRFFTS